MRWLILVNTSGTHYKYYSFKINDDDIFTGDVAWGRIGHPPTPNSIRRYSHSETLNKYRTKMNSGYRFLTYKDHQNYPNPNDVVNEAFRNTPSSTTTRTTRRSSSSSSRRTSRNRTSSNPGVISIPSFSNIPSYKTDGNGYMKKYRSGYNRVDINSNVYEYTIIRKEENKAFILEKVKL